jgi:hypothetical protein
VPMADGGKRIAPGGIIVSGLGDRTSERISLVT